MTTLGGPACVSPLSQPYSLKELSRRKTGKGFQWVVLGMGTDSRRPRLSRVSQSQAKVRTAVEDREASA